MSSSPPQRLSRESLARLLAAAQHPKHPKKVTHQQLRRYLVQWFPEGLWASIYRDTDRQREAASNARQSNPFQRLCKDPPRVSPVWTAALELVALSRLVKDSTDTAALNGPSGKRTPSLTGNPTTQAAEHLLRFAVFPPDGWAVSLALLETWRDEEQLRQMHASLAPSSLQRHDEKTATTAPAQYLFPSNLTAPAAAQLLHHISLAPPSTGTWRDALLLYQRCAAAAYTPSPERSTPADCAAAAPPADGVVPASSAFLKALRHMCLTTLLQAGEWERGLRFYFHSLYQRDLPGTVTTGYLVQALGKAGQWSAVLQVYELCVRLLQAQREARIRDQPQHQETPSREWGTTLSMAMAAVQHCPTAPPATLMAMVAQLQPTTAPQHHDSSFPSSPALPPLVQLDGNFLSAVQALPAGEHRVAVLRAARQAGLLDTFKLIRGLVSRQRWEDALLLFGEAMKAASTTAAAASHQKEKDHRQQQQQPPMLFLTRREVGEARRSLLHGASLPNVAAVIAALNQHRREKAANDARRPRRSATNADADNWMLNDLEVECVLSKTLEAADATVPLSNAAADFWYYCLQVLDHNYGTAYTRGAADGTCLSQSSWSGSGSVATPLVAPDNARRVRRPTTAALSFLLRHPRLPWHIALRLVEDFNLLDPALDKAGQSERGGTHSPTAAARAKEGLPRAVVTPRALALSAAVACLSSQGQQASAEELACRALDSEVFAAAARASTQRGVSVPASLLQVVSFTTLWDVLVQRRRGAYDGLFVEGRVLFHLLRESTKHTVAEPCSVLCNCGVFLKHPCGRALTVVHVLLQRSASVADGGVSVSPSLTAAEAVRRLPADLFLCEGTARSLNESRGGKVTSAPAAGPSVALWLTAYPSSVHCEVLRVIRCVTASVQDAKPTDAATPSNPASDPASLLAAWRWTWTLRYLHILATFFASAQRRDTRGARGCCTLAEARTAYYVATFEAVVVLLDTPSVPCVAEDVGGDATPPQTSSQRVTTLCQLLERAVARYGCVPPTHMLLPNQLDRLLPPLVRAAVPSVEEDDVCGAMNAWHEGSGDDTRAKVRERCAVATHLIHRTLQALEAPPPSSAGDVTEPSCAVEPVLLNNLLKLCCRVAEYGRAMAQEETPADGAVVVDGEALCRAGERVLRLQCERCGLHTVRPSTLTLLYRLCAAAQNMGGGGSAPATLPKNVALRVTDYLLQQQQQQQATSVPSAALGQGRYGSLAISSHTRVERQERRMDHRESFQNGDNQASPPTAVSVVQAHHCRLFLSLFGWEDTLDVWYPAFPRYVLNLLADTPRAVEACLSLAERAKGGES